MRADGRMTDRNEETSRSETISLRAYSSSRPTWWLPLKQYGSVQGGSNLSISGSSFVVGHHYTLHFFSPRGLHDTSSAKAFSENHLSISAPAYSSYETAIKLALFTADGFEIKVAEGNETGFEYRAAVTSFIGSAASVSFPPTEFEASYGAWGIYEIGECPPDVDRLNFECDASSVGGSSVTVRGAGFDIGTCATAAFPSCTTVEYKLVVRGAKNTSQMVSATAQARDLSTIIFTMPLWPFTAEPPSNANTRASTMGTPVSMRVSRGGIERIQSTSAILIYRAEYSSVFPVTVEEKDVLQIRGWGFAAHEEYYCALSRPNATGHAWLAEERAYITATVINSSLLLCPYKNATVLHPMGAHSYNFSLYRASDVLTPKLPEDVSFAASVSVRRSRGWGAFYSNSGGDIELSILMALNKTRLSQVRPDHVVIINSKAYASILRGGGQSEGLSIRPSGTWSEANVTSAPAIGGTPIQLEIYGLQTSEYAASNRRLAAVGTGEVLSSLSGVAIPRQRPGFPGVTFDLFAKRHAIFEGLDFATRGLGEHTVWLYMRNGSFSGHESGDLRDLGWELLNPGGNVVNVTNQFHATLNLGQPRRLIAGSTSGVLVVSSRIVQYSETGSALDTDLEECCATYQQSSMSCCNGSKDYSDGFLSIRPGRLVMAQVNSTSAPMRPDNLAFQSELSQEYVFFPGAVLYGYDAYGPKYECKFQLKENTGKIIYTKSSAPTIAAPLNSALMSVSTTLDCVVPFWEYSADFPSVCSGHPAYPGSCSDNDELGKSCGGHCQNGKQIAEKGTCSGRCMCNFFGVVGRPVCSGGSGTCFCHAPNTNASCYNDTACSGGGGCVDLGQCQPSMGVRLYLTQVTEADGSRINRTIPYLQSDTRESAANVELYAVWSFINTSVTWAKGGELILIQGSGFDASYQGYKCQFIGNSTCDNGTCESACRKACDMQNLSYSNFIECASRCNASEILFMSTQAIARDSGTISCIFPQWNFTASKSGMHLSEESLQFKLVGRRGRDVQYVSANCGRKLPYPYTSCIPPSISVHEHWSSLQPPLVVLAGSGSSVHIAGNGFSVHSTAYTCWFQGPLSDWTVHAIVLSHATIACKVPEEAVEEYDIRVRLLHHGVEVRHLQETGSITNFSVMSSWSAFAPVFGGAEGGTVVSIAMYGMPATISHTYQCSFRVDGIVMTSNASLLGNLDLCRLNGSIACELECISPSFGVGRNGIAASWSMGLEGISTELSVVRTQQCAAPNSTTTPCNQTSLMYFGDSSTFMFFSTFASMSLTEAYANGGQELVLQGTAFIPLVDYACQFASESTQEWSKPAVAANNMLTCITPSWGASREAATVNVSLLRINANCTELWWEQRELSYGKVCVSYVVPRVLHLPQVDTELAFVPVWTAFSPRKLYRTLSAEIITVEGWGFPSAGLVCRFFQAGLHLGNSTANTLSPNILECLSPSWIHLPTGAVMVQMEIVSAHRVLKFLGNTSMMYVLNPASRLPITTAMIVSSFCLPTCQSSSSEIRIPQDQSLNVTWSEAQVSPYTSLSLSNDSACRQQFFMKIFPLLSTVEVLIENDFNFTGRIFICYSTDGSEGDFYHQSALTFVSEARASSSSIFRRISAQLGAQQSARIVLMGAGYSYFNFVAFHLGEDPLGQCSWNESQSTGPLVVSLNQGSDMQSDSFLITLPLGAHRVCYSTGGGSSTSSWVLQALPNLQVFNASHIITSLSPVRAAPDLEFNVTFVGVLPSLFTAVALALPGQCMRPNLSCDNITCASACHDDCAAIQSSYANFSECVTRCNALMRHSVALDHSTQAAFTLGSGVYVACHSTNGVDGPYVEQSINALQIIPSSEAGSIRGVLPAKIVAGQSCKINFKGFHVSAWSYISISSDGSCQPSFFLWISPHHSNSSVFDIMMDVSGRHTVCYTTGGQDGVFVAQTPALHVIARASVSSILHLTPTRVAPLVQTTLTLFATDELYSTSSFIFFARSGFCGNLALNATAVNLTYSNDITISIAGQGEWVVCYSTDGAHGPFVQQGPTVFGIAPANASRISHLFPSRITIRFATEVEFSGIDFSELHSYVAFSLAGDCSNPVHVYAVLTRSVVVNVSSSALTEICYSTSGVQGPFVAQISAFGAFMHYVEKASAASILRVAPSRITAGDPLPKGDITGEIVGSASQGWKSMQHSTLLNFAGADYSSLVYVALTRTGQCSNREYTTALFSGVGSQAAALSLSVRYPGAYHVCYSVTGDTTSSMWVLQQAQLVVVPAAVTGVVKSLKVCGYDGATSVCVEGQRVRIPSDITFSFQFIGLDYSNNSLASFSRAMHPFFDRPDCSGSDWRSADLMVLSGTGNQSDAFFVTVPGLGQWHVCVNGQAGAQGSWWPQGEVIASDVYYVYIDVFEEAKPTSVTSMQPLSFERGMDFQATFEGLELSPFTRIGFALSGECNTNIYSEKIADTAGTVTMTAPLWTSPNSAKIEEVYKVCYKQVGQSEYSEQTSSGVELISMIGAGNRNIEYLHLQYLDVDSREHGFRLNISAEHSFSFIVYGRNFTHNAAVGLSDASQPPCTNVQSLPVVTRSGILVLEATVLEAGHYIVCYSTVLGASPVWLEQRGLRINVISKATANSIDAVQCIGPPQRCLHRCSLTVRAQTGVILRFSGAEYSPATRLAFTAVGDCRIRVLEAPMLPDLTVEFVWAKPGTLQICYSTDYDSVADATWQLQTNTTVQVTIETVWDGAALIGLDAPHRIQEAAGGQSITVLGSGFDPLLEYRCHLSQVARGISLGSTMASIISVDKLVCAMPSFHESSTLGFFSVRLGDGSDIYHSEPDARIFIVPEVVDLSPMCGDKLGGDLLSVRGFGFGGPANWSLDVTRNFSTSTRCQKPTCDSACVDACIVSAGCSQVSLAGCEARCTTNRTAFNVSLASVSYECRFEAQVQQHPTRPSITATTVGTLVSPTLITCQTPMWSETIWRLYRQDLEGKARVQIISRNLETSEMIVLTSSHEIVYTFTAVNKAPDFVGSSLGSASREAYDSKPITYSNWTRRIWRGRRVLHTPICFFRPFND